MFNGLYYLDLESCFWGIKHSVKLSVHYLLPSLISALKLEVKVKYIHIKPLTIFLCNNRQKTFNKTIFTGMSTLPLTTFYPLKANLSSFLFSVKNSGICQVHSWEADMRRGSCGQKMKRIKRGMSKRGRRKKRRRVENWKRVGKIDVCLKGK